MKLAAALLSLCLLCSVQAGTYTLTLASGPATQVLCHQNYFGGNSAVQTTQSNPGWVSPSSFPGGAAWIWDLATPTYLNNYQECFFSQEFQVQGTINSATLLFAGDQNVQIAVNGNLLGQYTAAAASITTVDFLSLVHPGLNIINFSVLTNKSTAGLIYSFTVSYTF